MTAAASDSVKAAVERKAAREAPLLAGARRGLANPAVDGLCTMEEMAEVVAAVAWGSAEGALDWTMEEVVVVAWKESAESEVGEMAGMVATAAMAEAHAGKRCATRRAPRSRASHC